jgi:hypothetical protein
MRLMPATAVLHCSLASVLTEVWFDGVKFLNTRPPPFAHNDCTISSVNSAYSGAGYGSVCADTLHRSVPQWCRVLDRDPPLDSDLLTCGSAKMSGCGAELERTGLGPHALPQKRSPFHGVCAVKTKYRTGIGPHLRMRKRQ